MFISTSTQKVILGIIEDGRLRFTETGEMEHQSPVQAKWRVLHPVRTGSPHFKYVTLTDDSGQRFSVREDYVRDLLAKGALLDEKDYPSHGDRIRKTIQERGTYNASLDEDDVFMIRWRGLEEGWSVKKLAAEYKVSTTHIRRILNNKSRVQN